MTDYPSRRQVLAGIGTLGVGLGTIALAGEIDGLPDAEVGLVRITADTDQSSVFQTVEAEGECVRFPYSSWLLFKAHFRSGAVADHAISTVAVIHEGSAVSKTGVLPGEDAVGDLCAPDGASTLVAIAESGSMIEEITITVSSVSPDEI